MAHAAEHIAKLEAQLAAAQEELAKLNVDAILGAFIRPMFEEKKNGWWIDAMLIEGAPSIETLDDVIKEQE